MTIFRFDHPTRPERRYIWDLEEGLFYVDDQSTSLDRSTQSGNLLYRYLEHRKVNRYGMVSGRKDPKVEVLVRTYNQKIFEILKIPNHERELFIRNIRGYGYEWLVKVEKEDDKELASSSPKSSSLSKTENTLETPLMGRQNFIETDGSSPTEKSTAQPLQRNLHHLLERSKVQAYEAGLVLQNFTRVNLEEADIHLDQGLYVHRALENSLLQELLNPKDESKLLVVIGEAGYGKTSLLWHFYRELEEHKQWCPVFIDATWLAHLFRGSSPTFGYREIVDALQCLHLHEKRAVFLLDSVDLLLHSDADRSSLFDLIHELGYSGCRVMVSTRPQEALKLKGL